MRLLLDTHALAWWVLDEKRLSTAAKSAISSPDNEIVVSVVSAFEMGTKHRLGKWDGIGEFARSFRSAVTAEGFEIADVNAEHAILAGVMPGHHRDPFDRLLAAQAKLDSLVLVTADTAFSQFDIDVLW